MSSVFLLKYGAVRDPLEGLEKLFFRAGFAACIPRGSVAIKLHMGELGNIRYLRPVFARKVVDLVRGKKGKPFLFDTVSNYPAHRSTPQKYLQTAARNGYAPETVNAFIIITDDNESLKTVKLERTVDGCKLKQAKIPAVLLEAQALVVLSHVKGHDLTGFGGAIKNLGMGCVSNETKRAQHKVNEPVMAKVQDCTGCKSCVEACATGAIHIVDGVARKLGRECIYCSNCYFVCPQGCWVLPPHAKETLQVYLAHAAAAVYQGFKGKMMFLNFIQDVVHSCDCAPGSGEPLVKDVGIAASFDPVALDRASLQLVDKAPRMSDFKITARTDILGKLHGTDSLVQIKTAEKLGMGTAAFELREV